MITEETRKKLSLQKIGVMNPNWVGGKPKCLRCDNRVSRHKGVKYCIDCIGSTRLGKDNPAWRGGVNSNREYQNKMRLKRYHKNKDYHKNWKLKKKFGITLPEYQDLYTKQKGGCAICGGNQMYGGKIKLAVDHDHKEGVVRGLLCDPCNLGIGKFGDNAVLLQKAVNYLKQKRNVGL